MEEDIHAQVSRIANERERLHDGDPSGRQLTRETHRTGLIGEFAFGAMVGLFPDTSAKRRGDGGVDFTAPLLFTIDVKTRPDRRQDFEMFMLVEEGKVDADIYVCAITSQDRSKVEMIGWQWKAFVQRCDVGSVRDGIRNHMVPLNKLRPMEELTRRIPNWRQILKR